MKSKRVRRLGIWILCVGVMMMLAGIITAITVGVSVAFALIAGSVLVNSAAVICIRFRG